MTIAYCGKTRFDTHDDPEQIACCLSCTLPECRNCSRVARRSKTRSKSKEESVRSVARLHRAGKTIEEIAAELGKSVWTVRTYISAARRLEENEKSKNR